MSSKEARRVYVLEQVIKGVLTISEASMLLGISDRQVQRLKLRMASGGAEALAHRSRGRKPANALAESIRKEIMTYSTGPAKGASCAHLADLLGEYHQVCVSAKTIGRILKSAGVVNLHTHKAPRRFRRRPRLAQEGLMIILDASLHDWLEGRGPKMSLHGAIDDATGKVTGLYFRPNEDLSGYLHVLDQTLRNYGVPHAAYTDRHTIFVVPPNEKTPIEHQLVGIKEPLSQFGMALADLDMRHARAKTPQAKGRVERLWGTLQERLIIEMRLAGIKTEEEANAFLPLFIKRHNRRFAVEASNLEPAWRPKPHPALRKRLLAHRDARRADNGSAIAFEGQSWQVWEPGGLRPKGLERGTIVWVHTHLDGTKSAVIAGQPYQLKPSDHTVSVATRVNRPQREDTPSQEPKKPWKPPASHPWRKAAELGVEAKARKLANAK